MKVFKKCLCMHDTMTRLSIWHQTTCVSCSAKPNDFDYLKVIGKGSFGKVLLAKHKKEGTFYAVKVLQKKSIMKRNEVNKTGNTL